MNKPRFVLRAAAAALGAALSTSCLSSAEIPSPPPPAKGVALASPGAGEQEGCPKLPNDRIYRFIAGEDRCSVAMEQGDIARELNDPFARNVLRKGRFPTHADGVVEAIRDAQMGLVQASFVVAEGGQIPTTVAPRDGVIMRKLSHGTHSEKGSRFIERILTVHATLRLQKRNVLDFVRQACEAALHRTTPPSLVPAPSTPQPDTAP